MNKIKNRRMRQFFANKMHRQMFMLVFLATLVPTMITAIALFYLMFNVTADQLIFPEMIATNLFPAAQRVIIIISIATPIAVIFILIFAHHVTHRTVGPFDRILRELDQILEGTKQDKIVLRSKDKFSPLVDKINQLVEKTKRY